MDFILFNRMQYFIIIIWGDGMLINLMGEPLHKVYQIITLYTFKSYSFSGQWCFNKAEKNTFS